MATRYQAGNVIEFIYDYVDQDGVAIDISAATSVTLYLYLPDGNVKTVTGSYSATTDKNRAIATITSSTITNANLTETTGPNDDGSIVQWQFTAPLGTNPNWSPLQSQRFFKNLNAYV